MRPMCMAGSPSTTLPPSGPGRSPVPDSINILGSWRFFDLSTRSPRPVAPPPHPPTYWEAGLMTLQSPPPAANTASPLLIGAMLATVASA